MRKIACFLFATAVALFSGCASDEPVPGAGEPAQDHTLIIYMMGDCGLETFLDANLSRIMSVIDRVPEGCHVALYYDRGNYARLTELVVEDGMTKQRLIQSYVPAKTSSVDPEFMAGVLDLVRQEFASESYGLILSSHGGGWVPSEEFDRYMARMQGGFLSEAEMRPNFFGQDGFDCMEIPDLVRALSGFSFDYILFDACFMSSVEALYDLRETADYIVASPAEVLGAGFPYKEILPLLFRADHGLVESCRAFMDFFRTTSGTIALVDCSKLDRLAQTFGPLLVAAEGRLVDATKIQAYEGFTTHLYFDLEQYAEALTADQTLLAAFRAALREAVVYTDHTPTFFTDYGVAGDVSLPRSCGVTCHVEQAADPQIHEAFLETAWAKAVGAK
ncbi:MAG: hypothetical protein K2O63_05500 [Alistipes sp.]|nr:hypothetical protein [Alistipes sp.]